MQRQKLTASTKKRQIERNWHLIDANGQILGRTSTKISQLLMGKDKPYFVRYLDCGDHVVVINAKKVQVTGRKAEQKVYTRYSGYPGGLKKETLKALKIRRPEEIIRRAVWGMLPKNKLRKNRMKRLFIFSDANHKYQDKFIKDQTHAKTKK